MSESQKRLSLPWRIKEALRLAKEENRVVSTLELSEELDADPFDVLRVLRELQKRGEVWGVKLPDSEDN